MKPTLTAHQINLLARLDSGVEIFFSKDTRTFRLRYIKDELLIPYDSVQPRTRAQLLRHNAIAVWDVDHTIFRITDQGRAILESRRARRAS